VISTQFYSYSSTPVGWQLIWPACAGLRVYDKTTNNPSKSKQAICMRYSTPERSNWVTNYFALALIVSATQKWKLLLQPTVH